jgi:hypothetical protein
MAWIRNAPSLTTGMPGLIDKICIDPLVFLLFNSRCTSFSFFLIDNVTAVSSPPNVDLFGDLDGRILQGSVAIRRWRKACAYWLFHA